MIFGTVGMHDRPFDRLIRALDAWAASSGERVVVQTGVSDYRTVHAERFDYAPFAAMRTLSSEARVVVTHGGAGSILMALEVGASVVVVPRHRRYGELMDEHQLAFAQRLSEMEALTLVERVEDLPEVLRCSPPKSSRTDCGRLRLVEHLRRRLTSIDRKT